MTESVYTLTQRRMRDALHTIRDFDTLKDWLDQHVVGDPVTVSDWSQPTVDERRVALREQANEQYMACLERGFAYDGGQWRAEGPKRRRVVEIVAQINAGMGLPQGKSSLRFWDMSGTAHDFSETQMVELGNAGNDLVDAADDNLADLQGQISAATSLDDLDAINVESGWPN